jgi:LPXTG-motif cell wall-anchored protein
VDVATPRTITEYTGGVPGDVIGTIEKGSAVVTLPATLTDRLENGTHSIEVLFMDFPPVDAVNFLGVTGSGSANIRVSRGNSGDGNNGNGAWSGAGEPISPRTGDNMNLTLWLIITAAALIALLVTVRLRRKTHRR